MYCARRELCARARAAQRSVARGADPTTPALMRGFGTSGCNKVYTSASCLANHLYRFRPAHETVNPAFQRLTGWPVHRPYSTESEGNRFDDMDSSHEPETTAEKAELPAVEQDSQSLDGIEQQFKKKVSLPYRLPPTLKKDKKALQRARHTHWEQRHQWHEIKTKFSESDLVPIRRTFNKWKNRIKVLDKGYRPVAHPLDRGKWLYDLSDVGEMRVAWESLSTEEREQKWHDVMLATLRWRPSKATMVLDATMNPLPPGYAIHDVLRFLGKNLRLDKITNARVRSVMAEEIVMLLARIIDETPKGYVPFAQPTFGFFAKQLPAENGRDLYELLQREGYHLHKHTLLQFAQKFAREPAHKNAAYEILKTMLENGESLNDVASASTITSLLHCKAVSDGWSRQVESFAVTDALELFLSRGYTPDVIALTAVLDSLCQHGEVEEAIRLALLFAESGLSMDAKMWTTVFAGAKSSLSVENIGKALMVAKIAPVPEENILSNALHAVFYFAEMETRSKKLRAPRPIPVFRPMLRAYAKRFELKSLQWWMPDSLPLLLSDAETKPAPNGREWDFPHGILPMINELCSAKMGTDGKKLAPNSAADGVMLRAYIRSLEHPDEVLSFYKFFKSRLEEKDKHAQQLLESQGALIHDTFISKMTEYRELTREALFVLGDMLSDSLRAKGSSGGATATEVETVADEVMDVEELSARVMGRARMAPEAVHPMPTVFTMTILLRGLLQHGEAAMADQLLQSMQELDVVPNLVTWNTLIRHYALAQNTKMTVALLQDMEVAGMKPDQYTYSAFNKLRDQNKALQAMQAIVDQNHRDLVARQAAYS